MIKPFLSGLALVAVVAGAGHADQLDGASIWYPQGITTVCTDNSCRDPRVNLPPDTPRDDTSWHLLTTTDKGVVSLIKGLSKHECEFARDRFMGYPATDAEKQRERERDDAMAKEESDARSHLDCDHDPKAHAQTDGGLVVLCQGGSSWPTLAFSYPQGTAECFQ